MEIRKTNIPDLNIVIGKRVSDDRGSLARYFCKRELSLILNKRNIVQINHTITKKIGSIRGMHFQYAPHMEMKIIKCIRGSIWDVAVDLRKDSQTYLKWHAEYLSPKEEKLYVIPEGFAHGFQVLEGDSELLYFHTEYYSPEHEGGIRFDDPEVNIQWPLEPTDISKRDLSHPLLKTEATSIQL